MQDEEGQITEAHSISAGLDYPGTGPQHAFLRDSGRARYVAVTDARGARRLPRSSPASRGSSRRWRPRTRSPGCSRSPRASSTSCACPAAATRTSPRCSRSRERRHGGPAPAGGVTGAERLADAFASAAGRAALMPYLMGGFPTLAQSLAIGEACVAAGADVLELGVPVLGSARRRAGDPRGGHAGARRGRDRRRRARGRRRARRATSRSCSCATRTWCWPRESSASRRGWRDAGVSGLIVPDLPLEEAPEVLAACDGARRRARAARRAHDPGRAPRGDRRARPRLPLHGLGRRHDRRAGGAVGSLRRGDRPRPRVYRRAGCARLRHQHARAGRARRPTPGRTGSSSARASCAPPPSPTIRRPRCGALVAELAAALRA